MSHKNSTRQVLAGVGVAAGALLAAATIPVATAPTVAADDITDVASDVALASSALDALDPGAAAFLDFPLFFTDELGVISQLLALPIDTVEDLLSHPLDAPSILLGAAEDLAGLSYNIVIAFPANDLLDFSLPVFYEFIW